MLTDCEFAPSTKNTLENNKQMFKNINDKDYRFVYGYVTQPLMDICDPEE